MIQFLMVFVVDNIEIAYRDNNFESVPTIKIVADKGILIVSN